MARFYGTTEQRGLGTPHRTDKERLLALHREGDPCWRCGQPMYKSQDLERDHVVDRARGGANGPAVLAHMACNRAAGARLGNQMQPRAILAAGHDVICAACGKPYHYAARACEICGTHYHPNHGGQRSCSRACGVVLKRRNKTAKGWVPKAQRPKPPLPLKPIPADAIDRLIDGVTGVMYYTCRYCRKVGVTKVTGQPREVCPEHLCQMLRRKADRWRKQHGLTDTALRVERDALAARSARHPCPACGERTGNYRWCDACRCTSLNAKGYRCGSVASTDGKCELHAGTALASSRQW